MAKYWVAKGTRLFVDKTGGTDPTSEVGRATSIEVNPEVGSVDATCLTSTWKEYLPGLPDGGECTFEMQYDPTDTGMTGTHVFLSGLAANPQVLTWKVTYPTVPPTGETFSAFLTSGPARSATGPEEILGGSVTLKITGAITPTP